MNPSEFFGNKKQEDTVYRPWANPMKPDITATTQKNPFQSISDGFLKNIVITLAKLQGGAVLDGPTDIMGNYTNNRMKLRDLEIDQYFHPNVDVFPKTKERPTALSNADTTQEWRTLKSSLPDTLETEGMEMFSDNELPLRLGRLETKPYLGLGNYVASIGKNDKGHYLSVYDSWDFKEPGSTYGFSIMDKIGRSLFDAVGGKGFNVYDRFYFTPDTIGSKLRLPSKIPINK